METKYTGTVKGTIEHEGKTIEYKVKVSGSYYFSKGRMYMKNGDPGYPDDEECEGPFFESVEEYTVYDDEGNECMDASREQTELLIQKDVEDNKEWDDCEWDEPDYPESPEPPEDD